MCIRDRSAASAAVKEGGTIVLNDDVQLTEEDKLPDVACTIRSAGETKYKPVSYTHLGRPPFSFEAADK